MEGLEAAEITLSKLRDSASTFRIDADYFGKVYLEHEKTVSRNPERFSSFSGLDLEIDGSAFYPSIEPFYGSGDLPFLRVADVDSVINFDKGTTIPRELCDRFPTLKKVEKGDIVLTKGGSVARIGLVTEEAAACRDLIFVDSSKLPERDYTFLCFSLQTKFANDLLVRSSSQTAQPHLTLTLVRDIPLFWPGEALREEVLKAVKLSYLYRSQATNNYAQAETLLLRELGLEGWQPPEPLAYQSTFSQIWRDERIDAEHFQPKYEALRKHLISKGAFRLGDRLSEPIRRGISPEYVEEGGDVIVINSQHVGKVQVETEQTRKTSRSLLIEGQDKGQVRRGDVLLNSTGYITIGRCQCLLEDVTAVVDNHVAIIRPQSPIDPVYLACFLNSRVGQMQTESNWTGSSGQIELRPDVIADYLVWDAPPELQRDVRVKIETAHHARRQAKQLLETAKRAVEVAIEDSEDAALALLKQRTAVSPD